MMMLPRCDYLEGIHVDTNGTGRAPDTEPAATPAVDDEQRDGCGCLVSDLRTGKEHGRLCVLSYMVSTVPIELPIDEAMDRWRVRIGNIGATGDPAGALSQGEVLQLDFFGFPGLYQRWDDYFVPITLATYRKLVKSCEGGWCGQCQSCRAEITYYEDRTQEIDSMDEAAAKVVAAVENLLGHVRQENERSVGDDFDLSSVEASDAEAMLVQAGLLARNVQRITQGAVARVQRLNASSLPPKIASPDSEDGGRA